MAGLPGSTLPTDNGTPILIKKPGHCRVFFVTLEPAKEGLNSMRTSLWQLRLITVLLLVSACTPFVQPTLSEPTENPPGSGGINAVQHLEKPYVILVSIDGFRWDYMDLHGAPTLKKLSREGVHAERLLPVFPTLEPHR